LIAFSPQITQIGTEQYHPQHIICVNQCNLW